MGMFVGLDSIIYIYIIYYFACLSVEMFVSNKHQNGWTDRAHIICGTSHDPREDLWNIKIGKRKFLGNSWIFFENAQIRKKAAKILKWFKMVNF